MEFYGFSLWHDLLTGSQAWLESLGFATPDDFDPAADGFTKVFAVLRRVLEESGLRGKLGGCFHTSSDFPAILDRFDLLPAFIAARDTFAGEVPLELGMHCTFGTTDLPLGGRYPEVLARDLDLATKLGAVTIVAHFPKDAGDTTNALVDELLSEPVVKSLRQFPKLTICWENQGPKDFFGSLAHMIAFRERLVKTLRLTGANDLVDRHLFCLDTGHLAYWARQNPRGVDASMQEIDATLPKFAQHLKVFHIHANDGTGDNHLVPHSLALFEHKSREGVDPAHFQDISKIVDRWLGVCYHHRRQLGLHVHVEALKMPFSLAQLIAYGPNVAFFGTKPPLAAFLHAMPEGEQIAAWEVAEILDITLEDAVKAIAMTLTQDPAVGRFYYIKDTLTFTRETLTSEMRLRDNAAGAWLWLGNALSQRKDQAGEALYCYERAAVLGNATAKYNGEQLRTRGITAKKVPFED